MSKAVRAQLVKSVLTAVVTYHATVFNLSKWLIKKIDKTSLGGIFTGREKIHKGTRVVPA
jgi:hypothetical protein